jgi:hypothetical protein
MYFLLVYLPFASGQECTSVGTTSGGSSEGKRPSRPGGEIQRWSSLQGYEPGGRSSIGGTETRAESAGPQRTGRRTAGGSDPLQDPQGTSPRLR